MIEIVVSIFYLFNFGNLIGFVKSYHGVGVVSVELIFSAEITETKSL